MAIWIVQAQENPADPRDTPGRREWRSNTLAETLADRGHDVVRWRSAFSHRSKTHLQAETVALPHDNYTQAFIKSRAYRRHVGPARIRNHADLARNFRLAARAGDAPALIHVGNVPIALAHAAVAYGREVGCPVVVDIRDLWPDIYVDLLPDALAGLRRPLLSALHAGSFRLRRALARATGITALTDAYLDWALRLAGRPRRDADRVFAMCYPRIETAPPPEVVTGLHRRLGTAPGDVLAVYIGNIGMQSDFDAILRAARRLEVAHPDLKFVIAGSGPREAPLRAAARDLSNVIVPGWLQGPEVGALLHLARIGLIAFHPVPNYLLNIPNKYPEYLAGGLAIACGTGGEMARLTQKAGCGFVYPAGDDAALAQGISALMSNRDALAAQGARARALHADRFDRDRIYPAFADHLETLMTQGASPRMSPGTGPSA